VRDFTGRLLLRVRKWVGPRWFDPSLICGAKFRSGRAYLIISTAKSDIATFSDGRERLQRRWPLRNFRTRDQECAVQHQGNGLPFHVQVA
jgi:hypothetical protein